MRVMFQSGVRDISAPLTGDLVTWPGLVESFDRELIASLEAGDGMTVSTFRLGGHAGTHVDAPCHFLEGTGGVESLPVEAMFGEAFVVQTPAETTVVTADVLEAGGIPEHVRRVLLQTSNSGWTTATGPFDEDYVACDVTAAEWLLDRGVVLVGIDYLSIEPFDAGERGYPVHKALLGADVVVVEGLDLAGVLGGLYELAVLPLLVPGSDGAPARAVLFDAAD